MTRTHFVCPRNGEIVVCTNTVSGNAAECSRAGAERATWDAEFVKRSDFDPARSGTWTAACGVLHPHRVETLDYPRTPSPQFGVGGLWCEYHDTALVPA